MITTERGQPAKARAGVAHLYQHKFSDPGASYAAPDCGLWATSRAQLDSARVFVCSCAAPTWPEAPARLALACATPKAIKEAARWCFWPQ